MKVAALGRSEILYNTILKLKEAGHDVCLIITCKEAPDYSIGAEDFKLLAKKLNVPFLYTDQINSNEVINLIKNSGAEIGVSVNWRTLIGQEVIDCFRHGIINAHPGDLPRYRGNAVPNWAILNGEKEIVLTLHLMSVELDAGPIVLQRKMPISDRTYIGEVYDFINKNAPQMFVEVVKLFENNSVKIRLQPNNPALSLRCYPRTPKDGEIDWRRPAVELERLVRAASEPFAGAYTFLGTEKLVVWRAHCETPPFPFLGTPGQVAERRFQTGEVAVVTGKDFLVLEEVETKTTGRKKATEIIKTIRTRLGMDVTEELTRLSQELEEIKKLLAAKI